MTPRMRELLAHIERLTVDGVPPTYDQLKDEMGYASKSTIHRLMHQLAERGIVAMTPAKRRSVAVRDDRAEAIPFDQMANDLWQLIQNGHGRIYPDQIRKALVESYARAA